MPKARSRETRGKVPGKGFDKDRIAWVRTHSLETILFHRSVDTEDEHREVRLSFRALNARWPVYLSLSAMTQDELRAVKELVDEAFQRAEPLCKEYDERAQRRWEEEQDDSDGRLYRAVPVVSRRKRDESSHAKSVQGGLEETVGGNGTDDGSSRAGTGSSGSVDSLENAGEGDDDEPTPRVDS